MRTLLFTITLLALAAPAAAELSATVEPRVVDEFDTLRLTIRATGSNQAERLDLTPLEDRFEVLTTQSASQYRSVNGRVESWVEYQILLRPLTTGELTIPPIEVGSAATEALRVLVRGMDPELREAIDRMVFFETELTANPVYVQSQTVLIRRLFYASGAQIYSDLPGMPEIPNAIVTPLGETTSSTTIRNGQRYGVIEQHFAILPEQSGTLSIPAIAVTSSVRLEVNGRTRRSGVRVTTEPQTLEVLPIPPEYPADHPWLPAESLTVADDWEPGQAHVNVGDPLRRTVRVRVRGNVSSAIPPLHPPLPDAHFRRYPEPPRLDDDQGGASVRGTRQEDYAIIPTAPGTVHVPATEIVWWDVNARAVRTARAPGRTLTITGAPAQTTADTAAPQPQPGAPDGADTTADTPAPEPSWSGHERQRTVWLALLAAAVAGAVLAWLLQRARAAIATVPSERACRRALAAACRRGNARDIHQRLLDYLRVHYRAPQAEAQQRFRRDGHGAVLDQVNAACYGSASAAGIDGATVMAAVRSLRRPPSDAARGPLPALYD